jgi:hypothetical protein
MSRRNPVFPSEIEDFGFGAAWDGFFGRRKGRTRFSFAGEEAS